MLARSGVELGCLPLAVDAEEEPELYADLERLVQCDNVRDELQAMKAEVLDVGETA